MNRVKKIVLVVSFFSIVFPHILTAKKAVAWIVSEYKDCTVTRLENGTFKTYNAKPDMALYPGDCVRKPNDIKSVKFDLLPYVKTIIKDKSTLVIVIDAPLNKESIFFKTMDFLGLVKTKFKEIRGTSRGDLKKGSVPLENATLIADQKIPFDDYYKGKTVVFKELNGKEVYRKTFKDDLDLIPGKVGLAHGKTYIREIKVWKTLDYRSTIRVLGKKDEKIVKKALEKINSEKIGMDEKIVKKAAYLQLLSDLYPAQIDLYWLSFHILDNAYIKEGMILDLYDILKARCFDHFKGGISGVDFVILNTPGCLVTVELNRDFKTRFVSPDFIFKKDDIFSLCFQTNIKGHLVILHETGEQLDLAFPAKSTGYKIESKSEYRSCKYQLDEKPDTETYLFVLSDKPIDEMEKFQKISGDRMKYGELNPEQHKLLESLRKKALQEGQKIDLEIMGSKGFAQLSSKSFSGIIWFRISLENYGL